MHRRNLITFFAASYLLFWLLLGLTGGLMALHAPAWTVEVMKNVDAWAPNLAVLIFFRRLFPGLAVRDYVKHMLGRRAAGATPGTAGAASTRLQEGSRGSRPRSYGGGLVASSTPPHEGSRGSRPRSYGGALVGAFAASFALQAAAFLMALGLYCAYTGTRPASLTFLPLSALGPTALVTLTAGPLGEELGWRGYAYGELRERYPVNRAAVVLGLVWGFWHLPLWILAGYSGSRLAIYVASFLVAIVATSVIIARFFEASRNVLIACWIHFWFNFSLRLVDVDVVRLLACVAVPYAAMAFALTLASRTRPSARAA